MAYRIMSFFLLVSFFPLRILAQSSNGYEINGHINGLNEGEKVILSVFDFKKMIFDRKDSVEVKNGMFHLNGVVEEGPRYYMMDFSNHLDRGCRLLISNGEKLNIICDSNIVKIGHSIVDDFFTVKGSPSNEKWHKTLDAIDSYRRSLSNIDNYIQKIKDSIGFEPILIDSLYAKKIIINQSFMKREFYDWDNTYPKSIVPCELIIHNITTISSHAPIIYDFYKLLDENIKKSYYGKILKEYCLLEIGQSFPEFTLPTREGKSLSINNITAKSKLTIVHFWANKSVLREELDRELEVQYKKYHNKGLNIVGVSSDAYLEEWKEALNIEKYPWFNVIDQKGRMTNSVYHEGGHSIPNTTNVLIDNKGKIVAWDPVGIELQYYLWKIFGE